MKSLEHYWYQPNVLVLLLLPFSWLFCLAGQIRKKLYQFDIKKSFAANRPVVVVGNIVAGGSGKTPLLMSLCEYMIKQGFKPGVVSRGYGGSFSGVKQISNDDPADLVGDEPLMIFRRLGIPVVVAADRVSAVEYLLVNNPCDIVFSDDGLQHYRMQRDLEIAVVDYERKFGNGYCLPAGPLRERISRLQTVDRVIYNAADKPCSEKYFYSLQVVDLKRLNSDERRAVSAFSDESVVHAVAGIGNPSRFYQQLRNMGMTVVEHDFDDHHNYQQDDFSGWNHECIIMTEKDAVKCGGFHLTDAWVLRVDASLSHELESWLDKTLLPIISQSCLK